MCVFTCVFHALFIQKHSHKLQRLVQVQTTKTNNVNNLKSVGN